MDSDTLIFILLFTLFIAFFVYLVRENMKSANEARQALDAMADRRGWRIEHHGEKAGRGRKSAARVIITPRDDHQPWRLEVLRAYQDRYKKDWRHPGEVIFHAPEPAFNGAMAVFAAPTPNGVPVLDPPRNAPGMEKRRLLRDLDEVLGAPADDKIAALEPYHSENGAGMQVLATQDPQRDFDIPGIGGILTRWDAIQNLTPPPRLVIDDDGMRLFTKGEVVTPDAISAWLNMAFNLQEAVKRTT